MTQIKFWSEACSRVPVNLQDFILGASPLDENLEVETTFIMVFSDTCDDVSDRVVDQATYKSVLIICIRRQHYLWPKKIKEHAIK